MRVYTQELAGNIGWNVEITKIVWDAVRSILTLVIVEPKGATPEARKTPRKSIAPPQPDRVVTHDAGAAPTKEVLEAARRLSRLSLAPAPRRSLAPRASLAPSSRTDGAGSVRDGGGDALEGEDEEEDIVFRSGRGVGKRQVIASEDEDEDKEDEDAEDENAEDEDAEDEDEDEDEHEHSDDDMIDDDAIEDDLRDELEEHMEEADEDAGEDPFLSAQGSRAEREPSPAPEQPPPRTPASQAARRTSEQRSRGRSELRPIDDSSKTIFHPSVSQAAPSPKFKPEGEAARSPAPKVKQEKVHETPSRGEYRAPARATPTILTPARSRTAAHADAARGPLCHHHRVRRRRRRRRGDADDVQDARAPYRREGAHAGLPHVWHRGPLRQVRPSLTFLLHCARGLTERQVAAGAGARTGGGRGDRRAPVHVPERGDDGAGGRGVRVEVHCASRRRMSAHAFSVQYRL